MAKGLYFGGLVESNAEFVLAQQGKTWFSGRRENSVADDGSLDVLLDVVSSFVGNIEVTVTGVCRYEFLSVTSHTIGAGTSLEAWNRNTFFQATTSGDFSTEIVHTASYEVSDSRIQGVIPGGQRNFAIGGHREGNLILGPGQYALQVQNVSGGAADIAVQFSWSEPTIPNVP